MSIIPPGTWRLISRSGDDVPEAYIPLAPGPRSRVIIQRMIDGPTEEERVRTQKRRAKEEADRLAAAQSLRDRHEFLLKFAGHPALTTLLEQHAPHDGQGAYGPSYLECHGCPQYEDFDMCGPCGEAYHEWPCPTWQTISDATT